MFEGFVDERVDVGVVELRVRHAGSGPPILLVHGHPRTGSTWHRVAPRPKRTVALDLVRLMERLGHERFAAVGHDRGCYVAFRAAMDHPDVVTRLVVMDGVPNSEALERCDARFAHDWYHWFFFAQPDNPERAILADPDSWYDGDPGRLGEENHREFREATHDPATIVAMLEDYRAGLGIDRQHETDDRCKGRTVRCPTLFLHSTRDDMEDLYGDPLAIWRPWVEDLRGGTIESGHHMAEENPDDLSEALVRFLSSSDAAMDHA